MQKAYLFLLVFLVTLTFSSAYAIPPDPPKLFSSTVYPNLGVDFTWSAGATNGDTHINYSLQRLNLDGITWDTLTTQTGTVYFDPEPQRNDTAQYRIRDNGNLGFGCYQFAMNSTVITNLLSYFPFCNTTNDNGSLLNNGTVTGLEQYLDVDGIVSFDFNGTSYITLPNESDYDFQRTDPFSILFWANTTSGAFDHIVEKGGPGGVASPGFGVYISSGVPTFEIGKNGTNQITVRSDTSIATGTWTHVSMTYDGSGSASGVSWYKNGVSVTPTILQDTSTDSVLNNRPVKIGGGDTFSTFYTGQLYDVMIIDRELDSNEVNQIYNERIDTSTLAMLPNAVTDLAAVTDIDLSTVNLSWSAPFVFGGIDGYMLNWTSPFGDPLTIQVNNTGTTDTTRAITGLLIGEDYSFRVSPWNFLGTNGSGNIVNATVETNYEIGNFTTLDIPNTDDFSIFYSRTDINATSLFLNVTYPNTYTLECNMYYEFARTNNTYSNLTSTVVDADNIMSVFQFVNATGDIINVNCSDTITGDSSKYVVTITQFPFLDQIDNMRNGTYGTYFEIGAIDGITLFIIFIGMIGFNRTTPIAGVIFIIIAIISLSFFGIITYPIIMYPALALMGLWAFISTRKDD